MKKILKSLFKDKNKTNEEKYSKTILPKIEKFSKNLELKNNVSFLHYGHLGDIINCLPIIKEISKNKSCSLFIQENKPIPGHAITKDHPFGSVYLNKNAIVKLIPLLKKQSYLKKVEIYSNQEIDVDLNFLEVPINFNIDSIRWYFHLTGCFPDLSKNYLDVEPHSNFKNYIIIMRSLRRQNKFIDYSFLSNYERIVFLD